MDDDKRLEYLKQVLIMLEKRGLRSFQYGDLKLEFAPQADIRLPRPFELPTDAVMPEYGG